MLLATPTCKGAFFVRYIISPEEKTKILLPINKGKWVTGAQRIKCMMVWVGPGVEAFHNQVTRKMLGKSKGAGSLVLRLLL